MILITGANGFLGKHVVPLFNKPQITFGREQYDLIERDDILRVLAEAKMNGAHTIVHLAADVGGIEYNLNHPATIFFNNVMMNTQLINFAAMMEFRVIFVSSVCAYPAHPHFPTREHHLWDGYPEVSNGPYGISKRVALTQLEAYKEQHGLQYEYLILANLYGPGDESNHVIPDLIKKFITATWRTEASEIEIWGDGSQTRDFLFVRDAADAIKHFTGNPLGELVNVSGGHRISLTYIIELLTKFSGYEGKIVYNTEKPTGQAHRLYNIEKAIKAGWTPKTSFEDGLRETYEWTIAWMKDNVWS